MVRELRVRVLAGTAPSHWIWRTAPRPLPFRTANGRGGAAAATFPPPDTSPSLRPGRRDTIVIWYKGTGGYAGLACFELVTGTGPE